MKKYLKSQINKAISRYGTFQFILLSFYPILLPFFMIHDTSKSIYNIIRELVTKHDWKYLSGNHQLNAYAQFFYYIQYYNIKKFGRFGISNLLGGGNFSLKKLFHLTPLSLKLQSTFGTTFIMFFAMCFWLFSWVFLYYDNPNLYMLTIIFFSTLFFATFIEVQNYNILGWMLYPIFLTYLANQDYVFLTILLFFISLLSFTAFFVATIFVFVSSFYFNNYFLIFMPLFGVIVVGVPVFFSFLNKSVFEVLKCIGSVDRAKYSMKNWKKLTIVKSYMIIIILQYILVYYSFNGFNYELLLLIIAFILYINNELFIRFADQQTFYILFITLIMFSVLELNSIDCILFISFFIANYPVYALLANVKVTNNSLIRPFSRKPYFTKNCIEAMSSMFSVIPSYSRILVAYKNPEGQYSNIFNGHGVFNEPLQYAANINDLCIFPDLYMVISNNTEDSDESFWVNSEDEAFFYMKKNYIKYLILPSFYNEKWENKFKHIREYHFELDYDSKKIYKNYSFMLYEIKS